METIINKKSAMPVVINMYDWHTKLFKNVTVGISEKDAQNRLNAKANHVAWITGSLVHARYDLGKLLGLNLTQTSNELFKDNKGIQDNATYPSLDEFRKDWEKITPVSKMLCLM
jgi:hypothetical protein